MTNNGKEKETIRGAASGRKKWLSKGLLSSSDRFFSLSKLYAKISPLLSANYFTSTICFNKKKCRINVSN